MIRPEHNWSSMWSSTEAGVWYRERAPSAPLAQYIESFWMLSAAGPLEWRVLPDGCADVAFRLDPRRPGMVVVGPMSRPRDRVSPGRVELVGIRFRPGRCQELLGCPLGEVVDQSPPIQEISRGWDRDLPERLLRAPAAFERVWVIERAVLERLRRCSGINLCAAAAVDLIRRSRGAVRIEELARRIGITRQHLARLFETHIGLSPKLFGRIARFRAALELVQQRGGANWAALAGDLGYSDQAHLIREFAEFAGDSPARFFRSGTFHSFNTPAARRC